MTVGNGDIRAACYRDSVVIGNYGGLSFEAVCADGGDYSIKAGSGTASELDIVAAANVSEYEIPAKVSFGLSFYGSILRITADAMFDFDIVIRNLNGTRAEYFENYSADTGGVPCVKFVRNGKALYLFMNGMSYDYAASVIHIPPYMCTAVVTDDPLEKTDIIKRSLSIHTNETVHHEYSVITGNAYYRELCRRMSHGGGIALTEKPERLDIMLDKIKVFCRYGDKERAERLLYFAVHLTEIYRRLPQICFADGSAGVTSENTYSPAAMQFAESAVMYFERFGMVKNDIVSAVSLELEYQMKLLRHGMMPPHIDGKNKTFPPEVRFYGHRTSTLDFIHAVEGFARYSDEKFAAKAESAVQTVRKFYDENFIENGNVIELQPSRERYIKRPHITSGLCDGCRSYGSLEADNGRYLCVKCRCIRETGTDHEQYHRESTGKNQSVS